jgi:tellurite methyltransferase
MPAADRKKWDAKYAGAENAPREASAVLVGLADYLPMEGSALDIAGGAGRHAIWLAKRGLNVTLADISPVGLALAKQRAAEEGVSLETLEIDLEQATVLGGPYDLIVSVCYLCRHLFPQFPVLLRPGGALVVIQPTKANLARNDKPPAAYLLDDRELPTLVRDLELVHYKEGLLADGRHDAVLVARKAPAGVV